MQLSLNRPRQSEFSYPTSSLAESTTEAYQKPIISKFQSFSMAPEVPGLTLCSHHRRAQVAKLTQWIHAPIVPGLFVILVCILL
jgi:hypothetical protein